MEILEKKRKKIIKNHMKDDLRYDLGNFDFIVKDKMTYIHPGYQCCMVVRNNFLNYNNTSGTHIVPATVFNKEHECFLIKTSLYYDYVDLKIPLNEFNLTGVKIKEWISFLNISELFNIVYLGIEERDYYSREIIIKNNPSFESLKQPYVDESAIKKSLVKGKCHIIRFDKKDYLNGNHIMLAFTLVRYLYSYRFSGIVDFTLDLFNEGISPIEAIQIGQYYRNENDFYDQYWGLFYTNTVQKLLTEKEIMINLFRLKQTHSGGINSIFNKTLDIIIGDVIKLANNKKYSELYKTIKNGKTI
jgi:hypothetical protein